MNEVWKPLVGYEAYYEVSNLGRIRSFSRRLWNGAGHFISRQKIIHQFKTRMGYHWTTLNSGKSPKNHFVHRLVLDTFSPNPKPDQQSEVNHIDGDKSNNAVSNLEWCTSKQNKDHAWTTGLYKNMPLKLRINARDVTIKYPDGRVTFCSSSGEAWEILGKRQSHVEPYGTMISKRRDGILVCYTHPKGVGGTLS